MAPSRGGCAGGGSASGYIKTFSLKTGWGFIICDEVDRDVFFHASNFRGPGPEANVRPDEAEKLFVEFRLDLEDPSKPKALGVRILPQARQSSAGWSGRWSSEGDGGGWRADWRASPRDRERGPRERDGSAGGRGPRTSRERWSRGRPPSGSPSSRSRGGPRRNSAPESRPWRGRLSARGARVEEGRGGRRSAHRDGDRGRGCGRSLSGDREECGSERGRGGGSARVLDARAGQSLEGGQDSRPPLPRKRQRGAAQTASPLRLALRGASPPSRGAERAPLGDRLPARPPPPAPPRPQGRSRSRSRSIQRQRGRLPPRPPRPAYAAGDGAATRGAAPTEPSASRSAGPLPGSLPASWGSGGELKLLVSASVASALKEGPVQRIERSSSAQLRFLADPPRLHDGDLGLRVLSVSSSSGPSLRDAIWELLSELERGTGADQELQVRLLVQRWIASIIIGPRGNNIKDLCRGSGTHVRIDQWAPDGDRRSATVAHVRGPARRVLNTAGWIHQTIQDCQDRLPSTDRSGPPSPAAEAARAPRERGRERRPARARARSASRSGGSPPRGAGSASAPSRGAQAARRAPPGAGAGARAAGEGGRMPPEPPAPWQLEEHPEAPGEWYYLNTETGATTWDLPDEDAPPGRPPTPPSPYRLLEHPEAPGEWYYLNEQTGDTCWELPDV